MEKKVIGEVVQGKDTWGKEWLKKAINTEEYQRKHFEKFGYDALLEACRKYGAKVLIKKGSKNNSGDSVA